MIVYLVVDLDGAAAIGGQENLVTLLELGGDDFTLLFGCRPIKHNGGRSRLVFIPPLKGPHLFYSCGKDVYLGDETLADGNDVSLVQSLLSLLRDEDTGGGFLKINNGE